MGAAESSLSSPLRPEQQITTISERPKDVDPVLEKLKSLKIATPILTTAPEESSLSDLLVRKPASSSVQGPINPKVILELFSMYRDWQEEKVNKITESQEELENKIDVVDALSVKLLQRFNYSVSAMKTTSQHLSGVPALEVEIGELKGRLTEVINNCDALCKRIALEGPESLQSSIKPFSVAASAGDLGTSCISMQASLPSKHSPVSQCFPVYHFKQITMTWSKVKLVEPQQEANTMRNGFTRKVQHCLRIERAFTHHAQYIFMHSVIQSIISKIKIFKTVSIEQNPVIMATAASPIKLFEKKLTEEDIQSGLVLDLDSFVYPPTFGSENSSVNFNVVDEEGKVWQFRCFAGGRVGGVATRPVIMGGWGEFVRHHGLRVKDKVNFYGSQGERNDVSFVIHIRRTIRLFGVDITQVD